MVDFADHIRRPVKLQQSGTGLPGKNQPVFPQYFWQLADPLQPEEAVYPFCCCDLRYKLQDAI